MHKMMLLIKGEKPVDEIQKFLLKEITQEIGSQSRKLTQTP